MAEIPSLWRYLPLLHQQAGQSPLEEMLGCSINIVTIYPVSDR